jgi:hypothetical protein
MALRFNRNERVPPSVCHLGWTVQGENLSASDS